MPADAANSSSAIDSSVTFKGFGVAEVKAKRAKDAPLIVPVSYHPRKLGENDVEVKITHCGICASDIHTATEGWGPISPPTIVGHEVCGTVAKVGSKVSNLKEGQRVGVGPMVWACQNKNKDCTPCKHGADNHCPSMVFTYNAKYPDGGAAQGGYAEAVRVDADYVFPIPDVISSEEAAPLLCAGVTVFTPMIRFGVKSGMRVGVIGVGGLGHLAIQFANKLGAEVISISTSKSKEADAKKLGAKEHLDISDKDQVNKLSGTMNVIICTANAKNMDWDLYLSLMAFNGTFVLLALPEAPIQFSGVGLIFKQVTMAGSLIGGKEDMRKMFEFAAKHNIRPLIEVMPMEKVNEGIQKVEDNKVRYRVVLKN